jgi:hypothetical protein
MSSQCIVNADYSTWRITAPPIALHLIAQPEIHANSPGDGMLPFGKGWPRWSI